MGALSRCTSSHSSQAICLRPGLQITTQLPVIILLLKVILASRKSLAKTIHQLLGTWALTSFPITNRIITINFYTQTSSQSPTLLLEAYISLPAPQGQDSQSPWPPLCSKTATAAGLCLPSVQTGEGGHKPASACWQGRDGGKNWSRLTSRALLSALTSLLFCLLGDGPQAQWQRQYPSPTTTPTPMLLQNILKPEVATAAELL